MTALPQASNHYVYVVSVPATGEFYIGSRTTARLPEDDPYLGSGHWARRQAKLEKEVLRVFETRVKANRFEQELIDTLASYPGCMNACGHIAATCLEGLSFKVSQAFRKRFRERAIASGLKLNGLLFECLASWEREHGYLDTPDVPSLAIKRAMLVMRRMSRAA